MEKELVSFAINTAFAVLRVKWCPLSYPASAVGILP